MKRFVLIILALLLAIPTMAFTPQEYMGYSAVKTADALIHTGQGYFYGIVVATDGSDAVTVETYDNTAGSGTELHPDTICTTSASDRLCALSFDPPVPYNTGLYIDITTSGSASYVVYYREK